MAVPKSLESFMRLQRQLDSLRMPYLRVLQDSLPTINRTLEVVARHGQQIQELSRVADSVDRAQGQALRALQDVSRVTMRQAESMQRVAEIVERSVPTAAFAAMADQLRIPDLRPALQTAAEVSQAALRNFEPLIRTGEVVGRILSACGPSFSIWIRKLPLSAALDAREAALEGRHDRVAAFIRDWLGLKPTRERVEAVESALFEDEWLRCDPDDVIAYLRSRAGVHLRCIRPLGATQVRGMVIDSLDRGITPDSTAKLLDLARGPNPIEALLMRLQLREGITKLRKVFSDAELRVIWRVHYGGWTWEEAARLEGLPGREDAVRCKLARHTPVH